MHRDKQTPFTTDSYEYYRRQRQQRRLRRWVGLVAVLIFLVISIFAGAQLLEFAPTVTLPTFATTVESIVAAETIMPTLIVVDAQPETVNQAAAGVELVGNTALYPPNLADLQALMLRLINEDRAANQLSPVAWDETLALAGQLHAEEMVVNDYLSHWNLAGHGPDHRYTLAGGQHVSRENVHSFSYRSNNGRGVPIEDWDAVIVNAQHGFMNSEGHRVNILTPSHTHVGIGMAYDTGSGQFRLAQEFGNQGLALTQPIPTAIGWGESVMLVGRSSAENRAMLLLNVNYEPVPPARSLTWLRNSSTYSSPAQFVDAMRLDDNFSETVTFDYAEGTGVYHIRIFAERTDSSQVLLLNHAIWVGR